MTLNVQNTTAGDPRRVQLNDAIRRVAPDVISLQEVMSTDHLEAVLDGTGLNGTHQSEVLGYEPPFVDKYGGTAVATRWPRRNRRERDPCGQPVHRAPMPDVWRS